MMPQKVLNRKRLLYADKLLKGIKGDEAVLCFFHFHVRQDILQYFPAGFSNLIYSD
jgi:hypothetical protein